MERVKSGFCDVCGEQRRFTKQTPNHALHIVLTIFTAGLWFIPYLFISFAAPRDYTCVQCGAKLTSPLEKKMEAKGKEWGSRMEAWADRQGTDAQREKAKMRREQKAERAARPESPASCIGCGGDVPAGAKFCPHCGRAEETRDAPTTP